MSEPYVLWQNGQNIIQLKAQGFTTAQLIASFSKLHIPPPSPEISMSLGIIQHVPATDQNTGWNEIGDGFYIDMVDDWITSNPREGPSPYYTKLNSGTVDSHHLNPYLPFNNASSLAAPGFNYGAGFNADNNWESLRFQAQSGRYIDTKTVSTSKYSESTTNIINWGRYRYGVKRQTLLDQRARTGYCIGDKVNAIWGPNGNLSLIHI